MKIKFYNDFHFGDLFVSRSLVKWVIENIRADSYKYHFEGPKCLFTDIPQIECCPKLHSRTDGHRDSRKGWEIVEDSLYINTWYCTNYAKYYEQTTLNTLYHIFKGELASRIGVRLPGMMEDYIPAVDYSYYHTENIDDWIKDHSQSKVLICNNRPLSGQGVGWGNFSGESSKIIQVLSERFPQILFLVTNPERGYYFAPNVFKTPEIINISTNDLQENGYLGRYCKVIVGSGSGPYTYCLNTEVLLRPIKMISFSNKFSVTFGLQDFIKDTFIIIEKGPCDMVQIISDHISS